MIPSENGVCRVYPSEGDFVGGITYLAGDWTRNKVQDSVSGKNGWEDERVDFLDVCQGLCFRNRRAGIRIANVDLYSKEGLDAFIDKYYEASEIMQDCTVKGSIILYANSKTRVELKKYFNNKKNPLTAVQAKPEQANVVDYYIDETVRIRPNNHILTTEERIA